MRFDDRLQTVLNLPPGDRHDIAVRWRQLVDLVARAGSNSTSPVVAKALEMIRNEAPEVDEAHRAAAARAVAALPLPWELLAYFARDTAAVSAPVLAAAKLEPEQWHALAALATAEGRRFIETLHPEVGGGTPDFTETLVEPAIGPTAAPEITRSPAPGRSSKAPAGPSLSEVVARIERRRRSRRISDRRRPEAAPGADTPPALFRWECGPGGEIAWVEGAPRGPLIGRSIAKAGTGTDEGVGEDAVRGFAMRAPFRDSALRIAGDGPVAGEWKISGVPAFDPADGRFAGYRGIALRDAAPPIRSMAPSEFLADPDSLRELVHELKTPLNAIMGFAEIIDGQFLGPADRRYRERAGEIVGHAQLLLAGIDDLDFAAKVHSANSASVGARVDLAELVAHDAPALRALAAERGVALEINRGDRPCVAAVEPELADRLITRLCTALADRAGPQDALRLSVERVGDMCRVAVGRPAALRGLSDAQLFGAVLPDPARKGDGDGFSLRLIRGLARIAGGDLVTSTSGLALLFPPG